MLQACLDLRGLPEEALVEEQPGLHDPPRAGIPRHHGLRPPRRLLCLHRSSPAPPCPVPCLVMLCGVCSASSQLSPHSTRLARSLTSGYFRSRAIELEQQCIIGNGCKHRRDSDKECRGGGAGRGQVQACLSRWKGAHPVHGGGSGAQVLGVAAGGHVLVEGVGAPVVHVPRPVLGQHLLRPGREPHPGRGTTTPGCRPPCHPDACRLAASTAAHRTTASFARCIRSYRGSWAGAAGCQLAAIIDCRTGSWRPRSPHLGAGEMPTQLQAVHPSGGCTVHRCSFGCSPPLALCLRHAGNWPLRHTPSLRCILRKST